MATMEELQRRVELLERALEEANKATKEVTKVTKETTKASGEGGKEVINQMPEEVFSPINSGLFQSSNLTTLQYSRCLINMSSPTILLTRGTPTTCLRVD